jgi:hypothetical protein
LLDEDDEARAQRGVFVIFQFSELVCKTLV